MLLKQSRKKGSESLVLKKFKILALTTLKLYLGYETCCRGGLWINFDYQGIFTSPNTRAFSLFDST